MGALRGLLWRPNLDAIALGCRLLPFDTRRGSCIISMSSMDFLLASFCTRLVIFQRNMTKGGIVEKHTISLSIRMFHIIEKSSELSGRTFEDELSHGIMMYFDPKYANQELQRIVRDLRGRTEELFGTKDNPLDSTLVSADVMYMALTRIGKLTENMRNFLTVLCENEDYLTNSAYGKATGLHSRQISHLLAWLTRYLKGAEIGSYTWKDYMEMDAEGRYRMPAHLRDVVREFLETCKQGAISAK